MEMNFLLADLLPSDWEQVRGIYLEGIASGNATFETRSSHMGEVGCGAPPFWTPGGARR